MTLIIYTLLAIFVIHELVLKNNPDFQKFKRNAKKEFTDANVIDGASLSSSSIWNMTWLNKIFGNMWKILIAILVLIVISSGFKIVSPGERWVKITLGKVSPVELSEWLQWKIPLVQTIKAMSVQVQKLETTSSSASKDLQSVQTDIAFNYNLKPWNVVTMFQNVGDEAVIATKIIRPAIQESVKAATAQFTAEELISKRPEVNIVMTDLLKLKLDAQGINVVAVNIVNFQFSEAFDLAIEAKVKAEQEALTEQNKLEQIKFQAQQKVETAKWEAESILLKAKAEAEANILVAESLTEQLVKYIGLEQWDGVLPKVTSEAGVILQWEF